MRRQKLPKVFQKYLKTAWVNEVYEVIAVEVTDRDPKIAWEIVGIYSAPNEDTRLLEKLADRAGYMGSIIGGDLNLPYADWNGHAEKSRGTRVFFKRLVWQNGYTQVVNSPTRGDSLPDVYHVRPESAFTSCSNVQRIGDHCGVLFGCKMGRKLP